MTSLHQSLLPTTCPVVKGNESLFMPITHNLLSFSFLNLCSAGRHMVHIVSGIIPFNKYKFAGGTFFLAKSHGSAWYFSHPIVMNSSNKSVYVVFTKGFVCLLCPFKK